METPGPSRYHVRSMTRIPALFPRLSRRAFIGSLAAGGAGLLLPRRLLAAPATPPLFEEVPPADERDHLRPRQRDVARALPPRDVGAGCAFLDYDNDGWMDIFLVNSGPCDFFTPKDPSRNALYQNNRDGTFTDVTEKAGVAGGDASGWAWPSAITTTTAIRTSSGHRLRPVHPVPQQRQRHLHRRHREGWPRRARVDYQRGLVRLRQRRPAGPVPLQLRRVRHGEQRRLRRQQAGATLLLHPAGLQADAQPPVSQQRGRHVHARSAKRHGHRTRAGQGARRRRDGHQQRRAHGPLRRQRHGAELPVREPRQGQMGGDRSRPPRSASAPTGSPAPGMGVDSADFDGDGWQDLFVANVDQEMFSLYQQQRATRPSPTGPGDGIAQATRLLSGWGLKFFDYDNDGTIDLILANGHPDDMVEILQREGALQGTAAAVPQRRRRAAQREHRRPGPVFSKMFPARGLAVGDYDNDGRLDVVRRQQRRGRPSFCSNRAGEGNHWVGPAARGARRAIATPSARASPGRRAASSGRGSRQRAAATCPRTTRAR